VSALGQLAGFALFAIVAFLYGASTETDTFFLALAVPTLVSGPVVNSIHSVFVPVITASRVRAPAETAALAGAAVGWVSIVGLSASVALAALTPLLVGLFDVAPALRSDLVRQTWLLAPLVALQTTSGILQAVLNADGKLLRPSLAFAARHFTACLLVIGLHPSFGARGLAPAFLAGAALQVLWLMLQARHTSFGLRPSLRVAQAFRQSLVVAGPLVVSSVLLQGGAFLLRAFASGLPAGSVTILDYATRLVLALVELVGSGVLLLSIVNWSELAALGDLEGLRRGVRDAVTSALQVLAPVAALLVAVRVDVIDAVLGLGRLDPDGRALTATVLGVLALGIPTEIVARLYLRLFLAWHETRFLATVAFVRLGSLAMAALALRREFGAVGLGMADVLSLLTYTSLLAVVAHRRFPGGLQLPWRRIALSIAAASVAGFTASAVRSVLPGWPPILTGGVAGVAGIAVLAAIGAVTGDLAEFRRRLFGRRAPARA
jgi:putative peptidoglycan lipid II flippase